MKISKTKKSGFSLIEIMVAIAIIAIIAVIAIPVYQRYIQEAITTAVDEQWHEIREAMAIFVVKNDRLPSAGEFSPPNFQDNVEGVKLDYKQPDVDKVTIIGKLGSKFSYTIDIGLDSGKLNWSCMSGSEMFANVGPAASQYVADPSYTPSFCFDTPQQPQQTSQQIQSQQPQASQQLSQSAAATTCPAGQEEIQSKNGQSVCVAKCQPGEHRDNGACTPIVVALPAQPPAQSPAQPPAVSPTGVVIPPGSPPMVAVELSVPEVAPGIPGATMFGTEKYEIKAPSGIPCIHVGPGQEPPAPVTPVRDAFGIWTCPALTNLRDSKSVAPTESCKASRICPANPVAPNGKPDMNTCPPGYTYVLDKEPAVSPSFPLTAIDRSKGFCIDPKEEKTSDRDFHYDSPAVEYKTVMCQKCSGPIAICEQLHTAQPCEWPANYCINELTNNADSGRQVVRGCGSVRQAYEGWFQKYSSNDKCVKFNQNFIYTADFYCEYACRGDNCNQLVNPPAKFTNSKTH